MRLKNLAENTIKKRLYEDKVSFNISNPITSSKIHLFIANFLQMKKDNLNYKQAKNAFGDKYCGPNEMASSFYNSLRQKDITPFFINNTIPTSLQNLWQNTLKSSEFDYKSPSWTGHMAMNFEEYGEIIYTLYVTVDTSDLSNVEKFVKNLKQLHTDLMILGSNNKKDILWKTHTNVGNFIDDNDSIKFYFSERSFRSEVKKIVDEWLSKNGIKTLQRQHSSGIDFKAKDKSLNVSFGQIISHLLVLRLFIGLKKIYDNNKGHKWTYEDSEKILANVQRKFNADQGWVGKIIEQQKDGKIDTKELLDYIKNVKSNPDIIWTSNIIKD